MKQFFLMPLFALLLLASMPCIQIALCLDGSDAEVISQHDEDILKELKDIFTCYFNNYKEKSHGTRQFAVLYYGGDNVKKALTQDVMKRCKKQVQDVSPRRSKFFLDSPHRFYDPRSCPFIAAKLIAPRQPQKRHTEKTIFNSLPNYKIKHSSRNSKNYYMYTYFEPCSKGAFTKEIDNS